MTETGIVVKLKGSFATVRFDRKTACENCNMCFKPREQNYVEIRVKNELGAKEGDKVKVAIGKRAVLTASFIVYIIPLLLVGIAVGITSRFTNEWITLGVGLGTLAVSFLLLIPIEKKVKRKRGYYPSMAEIIKDENQNRNTAEKGV